MQILNELFLIYFNAKTVKIVEFEEELKYNLGMKLSKKLVNTRLFSEESDANS